MTKKKIRNQNNEVQIRKYNTINLNWMMKLKTNKTFIKGLRKKRNKKYVNQNEEFYIW
jgi:hypothetical protein